MVHMYELTTHRLFVAITIATLSSALNFNISACFRN